MKWVKDNKKTNRSRTDKDKTKYETKKTPLKNRCAFHLI